MKVIVEQETSWKRALNAARRTQGKAPIDKEPSDKWRKTMLLSEHSPIKLVEYRISYTDLRQWVGVHLLRHEHMIPMIHSQREDRNKEIEAMTDKVLGIISEDIRNSPDFCRRDYMFQGQENDQDFYVNAQTLINISRKRLCTCAHPKTRAAWNLVKNAIAEFDPVMASVMVKNCVYSGFCRESRDCCGYVNTTAFLKEIEEYRKI